MIKATHKTEFEFDHEESGRLYVFEVTFVSYPEGNRFMIEDIKLNLTECLDEERETLLNVEEGHAQRMTTYVADRFHDRIFNECHEALLCAS